MSLAFWLCLLTAAGLYALVVLSPKVVRWAHRAESYAVNQQRLINLRREIQDGQRLSREWESRIVTDAAAPAGGQTLLVEDALRYHGPPDRTEPLLSDVATPRGLRLLKIVSRSPRLQTAGLLCSGVLLMVAFTMLTEPPATPIRGGWSRPHLSRRVHRLSRRGRLPVTSDARSVTEPF